MSSLRWKDILVSLGIGFVCLLLFHLDHLIASYSGWSDPAWWLHLLVDGSYVLIYGTLGWLVLRGWRLWRSSKEVR
jgi:hypothetical protein